MVEVDIAFDEDLDHILSVEDEMALVFFNDHDIGPGLLGKPGVSEPEIIDDWAIRMRVVVKTHPERGLEITHKLQKSDLQACEREGLS